QDLHGLSNEDLQRVAQEVRELIIDTIGEIGGHFGANLGACELAVAIHSLLDSPRDKVLWDVGHQAYPHKILTGRRDALGTIRQYGGLAPFCARHESEHDIMGAGHASTAIGYAVGIKEGMLHGGAEDGKVVAVVGDGATVKGKGVAPAEDGGLEGMEKWRAAKPKSIAQRRPAPSRPSSPAPPQYTQVFGEALVSECERDPRVIGITAAMNSGTGLSILQKALPDRYFDVGIAEQQAVLFAAGMALSGMRPVAAIYSTFLQRAFDQIVHDVCLQRLPVAFCMDRAGLVGDDGPTHHGVFDIAYLRPLPNMTLMAPRDEAMLVHMLHT